VTSRLVDGHRIPDSVAGHPAVELCNTRAGWGEPTPKEYLLDYATFVVWARENAMLSADECRELLNEASHRTRAANAVLANALRLRDYLYLVYTDPHLPVDAAAQLRRFVDSAVRASSYQFTPGGQLRLDGGFDLATPVHRAALAGHSLLDVHGTIAVRRCAGQACGWLFFDPAGRRRWCTMAVCGNRAKARRFAERQPHRPEDLTSQ
jgi:predicted RNA-binding Zn ribbon-like protein